MPLVESGSEPASATSPPIDAAVAQAHWRRTSSLMWVVLAIWFIAGFGVHFVATAINHIHILGFPLGFYMAAQGSLIIFVVGLFWFGYQQNKIDEEFGVQED